MQRKIPINGNLIFSTSAPLRLLSARFHFQVASKLNGQYQSSTDTLKTPKAPNAFATFVKENYKNYRTPGSSHKDAMSMLSKKFAEAKISK